MNIATKMKRIGEFEQAVIEIVDEGKAKNEKGELLYPVMQEPLVMTFFGAPDALYEVMTERPIMLLSLIQTNKALETFWKRFEDIWIRMIYNILEREINRCLADTYPFFVVANHRARQALAPLLAEINLDKYLNVKHYGDADFLMRSVFTMDPFNEPGKFVGRALGSKEEVRYQIIYYNPVTKLYVQLLQYVHNLQLYYGKNETRLYIAETSICLGDYIHLDSVNRNIDCLDDCFIVNITGGAKPLQYDLQKMKERVMKIRTLLRVHRIERIADSTGKREILKGNVSVGRYPEIVIDMFSQAHKLADRLLDMLTSHFNGTMILIQEEAEPIELNKALATPYYALLYDRDQGLYNTPDKQRSLLMAVLRNAQSSWVFGENMVTKYGQSTPLNCVVCHSETHSVDLLLMYAFCTDECRSAYAQ